jgi:uncharacterized coiled-coil protein SlyX
MTELKFNTPSEIEVYINPKKNGNISRDNEGFVNISEIRRGNKLKVFNDFKKSQKEYLDKMEKCIGEPSIKSGEKRSTWVHEKILERVLRWYGVDEEKVIDRFVYPDNRTIGSYQYDKVEIMVHLKTKHINASKFCTIFNTSVKRWNDLESTQNLFKLYCKTELSIESNDSSELVIKHGLGYDSNDVWIPQDLLPMLATWCSPEYALFASKVMNMYHTDPMKLAAMAIQEHDRQTGTKTTALLKSTDDDNEHVKNLTEQLEYVMKQVEENNATIIDQNNKIITLEELTQIQTKTIQKIKDNVYKITYDNHLLSIDNVSLLEQFKPVRDLMIDHPNVDISQLAQTRKVMLDKHVLPLEEKLTAKDDTIKTLQDRVNFERREKEKMIEELSTMQESYDDEIRSLQDEPRRTRSRSTRRSNKKSRSSKGQKRSNKKSSKPKSSITSALEPNTCSQLSIYTKRDHEGYHFALVPGRSTDFKKFKYVYRGIIMLDETQMADYYITDFAKNNRKEYDSFSGFTFILSTHTPVSFERIFSNYFDDNILQKIIAVGYTVKKHDTVCSY